MLGIRGEEEEQPARSRAGGGGGMLAWNSRAKRGSGRLTE